MTNDKAKLRTKLKIFYWFYEMNNYCYIFQIGTAWDGENILKIKNKKKITFFFVFVEIVIRNIFKNIFGASPTKNLCVCGGGISKTLWGEN